jgi:UDP-N-acetylmuramoyl-tripeptide--D-alanyl-D-alanine ligase
MFSGPVIAVTGSAGKTTTKELIAAALSHRGPVLKSIGNRNTEYTSPLIWADRTPTHWAVVVELAMRGHGQIRHLAEVHRPNVGVVTNVGTAHVEMVGSRAGIAAAKGELLESLPSDGIAVLWQEDEYLGDLTARCACPVATFGFSEWADCRILGYRPLDWSRCVVRLCVQGVTVETELPAIGRHLALNAAAALLVATRVGLDPASAAEAMHDVEMPKLRMQRVRLGGAEILLDTYNANPAATIAAIQTICELPATGRRLAVIGEMRELGAFEESGHRQVGRALAESGIDRVLLFGEATQFAYDEAQRAGFAPNRMIQAQSLEDVRRFLVALEPGDVVLIKGSRSLELESALPAEATAP